MAGGGVKLGVSRLLLGGGEAGVGGGGPEVKSKLRPPEHGQATPGGNPMAIRGTHRPDPGPRTWIGMTPGWMAF